MRTVWGFAENDHETGPGRRVLDDTNRRPSGPHVVTPPLSRGEIGIRTGTEARTRNPEPGTDSNLTREVSGNTDSGPTCTRAPDMWLLGRDPPGGMLMGLRGPRGRAAVNEDFHKQKADDTLDDANPVDTTRVLLKHAKAGSREALDSLFARHIPLLRRWATGRLPRWARDIADTSDLVQETVIQTFKRVEAFEPRGDGALQAYLRQAIMNRIRNEFRSKGRQPAVEDLDERVAADQTSPLEAAIRQEQLDRYDAAMAQLSENERDLIVARLELGLTYEEMAEALKKPSWNAARMATARALVRLAEVLRRDQ